MEWTRLISNKRLGQEHCHIERHDDRTEFKRDYDRLIFSAPFRRLQNKTQVFPLPGSVFVHNRLTHSLEVACVGMSLGNDISQRIISEKRPELWWHPLRGNRHDRLSRLPGTRYGQPAVWPFGRKSHPDVLHGRTWKSTEIIGFTGILGRHYPLRGQRQRLPPAYPPVQGAAHRRFRDDLLYAGQHRKVSIRQQICRKPWQVRILYIRERNLQNDCRRVGYHSQVKDGEAYKYARHPLVYLVEAADDICYEIMDIEDSHKLKILSYEETESLLLGFFDEEEQQHILGQNRERGHHRCERESSLHACLRDWQTRERMCENLR